MSDSSGWGQGTQANEGHGHHTAATAVTTADAQIERGPGRFGNPGSSPGLLCTPPGSGGKVDICAGLPGQRQPSCRLLCFAAVGHSAAGRRRRSEKRAIRP